MGIVQAEEPVCGKEGMFAAFDPLFEGRQHPRCPNPRFDPRPFLVRQRRLMGLSGSGSPRGHCSRACSVGFGHRVSIFLHPLAPPALPGFIATMGAVTPARPTGLLTSRACPGEGRGLPASRNRPSEPSVSNHRPAPMVALAPRPSPGQALTPQRHRLPHLRAGSGLHLCVAGSPDGTAESSFSSYGWLFRLLLLSTPPRGDAVTVGYRPE